ncbi:MAG: WYL domain-containing protein [Campylobacteraceae bacterium]|nr:WYL domain-containing protein [Campylobacteraceae bacterium]
MNNKTVHILKLLQKLCESEEIYPQKKLILDELDINERTLERYLKEIKSFFGNAILAEKKLINERVKSLTVYRLINENDTIKMLKNLLDKNSENIGWIFSLIYENDTKSLKELNDDIKDTATKKLTNNSDIFVFKTNPFEDTQNNFFANLQKAVKNMEYRDVKYEYETLRIFKNLKCLKLIFIDNNWYLACETEDTQLKLLRISFMKNVAYPKIKERYQRDVLLKYQNYFETMQNAMTLYNVGQKEAVLKADSKISRYFKKEMKPFFISQKFIKEESDGSIIFSIRYTQPLEILPFIKRWLPYMQILEPNVLRTKLKQELQKSLSYL